MKKSLAKIFLRVLKPLPKREGKLFKEVENLKVMILTNNSEVAENFTERNRLEYLDGETYLDVLYRTRDFIHKNHTLLTHPLSGSIKPNETPFKSVALSAEAGEFDLQSLEIIENAIATAEKLLKDCKVREWPQKIIEDFKLIDYNLIESGMESINQFS